MKHEQYSAGDLDERFAYHPPRAEGVAERHESVRAGARAAAERLVRLCPPGRELSLALTAIEEAMMWANAAIARNPEGTPARAPFSVAELAERARRERPPA